MAIASVSPSFTRKTSRAEQPDSRIRPELNLVQRTTAERNVDRKAFAIFLISVAIAGLLALLAINTALSQGAFELTRLNAQATTLNDQREAVMKKIAKASSPAVLAYRAKAAGMVASQSPRFLLLGPVSTSTSSDNTSQFLKVDR
jgi:cell division protein FtsL